MLTCNIAHMTKISSGGFGTALPNNYCHVIWPVYRCTPSMQGPGNSIALSSLFYILCLSVNSVCQCHFSHCEGLLLTLTRVFSVSAVHLKSLFLTDVTGQLVLLNKKPTTMHTCFSLCLVWIFTFLLPGFPSAFSFFFSPQHFFLGWIPRCFCSVSSSVFLELKAFFFLTPLVLIFSM